MTPRPAFHKLSTLLMLEVALVTTVVFACLALCLRQAANFHDKARMSEVLIQLSTARVNSGERIALDGALAKSEQRSQVEAKSDRYVYEQAGSRLTGTGLLRDGMAFELEFDPSLSANDLGWIVIWKCNARSFADALDDTAPPSSQALPADKTPFICRNQRGK